MCLTEEEHEVRLERIRKVQRLAREGVMCLFKYPKYVKYRRVCLKYFTAEITQFEYHVLHSQIAAVVLIYHS